MSLRKYDHLTCYYLSGTGNSYRAAQWLAKAADEETVAEVIPIDDARPKEDLAAGPRQLVGIYHPAHGLMPPWSMIKFLLFRLPWGRGAHAVVVSTRGGIPLPPIVIPGGAGLALFFPALVLLLKGYRVRGGLGVDMPINMLNVHGGLNRRLVSHGLTWGRSQHQRLLERVLAGRIYWHPRNVVWELAWCFPFVLWPIFPLAYLLVGRVFMGKLMFAGTACVGCGRCAKNCPAEAIRMVGAKPKTPYWTYHCEACMRCMGYCKFRAVQASHLWIVPLAYGSSFLTAATVEKLLAVLVGRPLFFPELAYELAAIALTFLGLVVASWIFFGLNRLKPLRTMFTYTTLTRAYPRRYHAPGTTSKELTRRSLVRPSRSPGE